MKKVILLLSVLVAQVGFSQNGGFDFQEVPNSGLPSFYGGSMVDGVLDGKKALLITGVINSRPTTSLYLSDGNKFSLSPQTFPGIKDGQAIFLDIDKDGDQDIALIGNGTDKKHFQIYENDNGTFSLKQDLENEALGYASIDGRDYNKDGYPDILVTGSVSNERHTKLFQNNRGTFEKKNVNLQGVDLGAARFIDIKGDGNLGIVVAGKKNFDYGTLVVYEQDGNGNFKVLTDYYNDDFGYENVDITVGRANNDIGEDFIALGKGYTDEIRVFFTTFQDGDKVIYEEGYFVPSFTGNDSKNTAILKDLDQDSMSDLVIIGQPVYEPLKVYMYKGLGDLGFLEVEDIHIDFGLDGSIATVDFDQDGDLDLAISGKNASGEVVSKLFRNNHINLSTKEVVTQEKISLYPNPVTHAFSVKSKEEVDQVDIYDISGRLLKTFISQQFYNISELSKGNYMVVVRTKNSTQKIKILKK